MLCLRGADKGVAAMTRIFVRHQVNDYEAWRKVYDDFDREALGVTAHVVYRGVDDPNDVTVSHDLESPDAAKRFLESPELGEAMQRAGVAGEPTIWITEEA